jgi:hypothetical protein
VPKNKPPFDDESEDTRRATNDDASDDSESESGPTGRASAFMKKALTVGVGALFLTEEGLRSLVSEAKLPKELLSGILDSANKTKTEFLQNLSRDVRDKVIDKIDPLALVQEFLSRNEVEFTIRVNVKPKKKSD